MHVEGIALNRQGRPDEALHCYDWALALRPAFAEACNRRAFVLEDFGRLDEAYACFARVVELGPQMIMARLEPRHVQFKLGAWEADWENYESH